MISSGKTLYGVEDGMEKEKPTFRGSRGNGEAVNAAIPSWRSPEQSGKLDEQGVGAIRLCQALQTLPIPALLLDAAGRIVFANREWAQINFEYEELPTKPHSEMDCEQDLTRNRQSGIEEALSMVRPQTGEIVVGVDETNICSHPVFQWVRMDDKPSTLLILKDLSHQEKRRIASQRCQEELKERRAELDGNPARLMLVSRIFTDSVDPIFITDLEGVVVALNQAAKQTYGWKQDELLGQSFQTIVSQDDQMTVDDLFGRCKRGEKVEGVEALHRKKSGELVPVLLSLSLLTNTKGEPEGIASITKSLADLKCTEKILRADTEDLKRSNKDLEEFAYVAAHDLREPLVGIAANLKLFQRRCRNGFDAEAHKFVSRALEIALRMDLLIQSLLSYSRLGVASRSMEAVDCNVLLHRAMSNLAAAIQESGAKITTAFLPTVRGNRSQIVQLFQNLLSNAIKFAGDGPLEIRIGAARDESGWRFSVRDNGIGIEPPYFDRVFRMFQRLEASSERPGSGIGLANCRKIVEHHGGRIWVESEPGKGSTFFFTIPDRTDSSDA
jgi:PAS domain S-box-containing protein